MLVHNVCSGQWTNVNESMSPNSRVYQEAITGASNMSYVQNGVKFDGMIDDVLIECKAGYSQFINKKTGELFSWFNGKQGFIDQALRQLNASGGNKIKWFFQEDVAILVSKIFSDNNIDITCIYKNL